MPEQMSDMVAKLQAAGQGRPFQVMASVEAQLREVIPSMPGPVAWNFSTMSRAADGAKFLLITFVTPSGMMDVWMDPDVLKKFVGDLRGILKTMTSGLVLSPQAIAQVTAQENDDETY